MSLRGMASDLSVGRTAPETLRDPQRIRATTKIIPSPSPHPSAHARRRNRIAHCAPRPRREAIATGGNALDDPINGKPHTSSHNTKSQIWVLALTSAASLMIALDVLVVSTALDQIGRDFQAPVGALAWTVNAYILTFAVLLMTATVAGDRYGRRRVFVIGLLLFTAASAGCAL